MVNGVPAFIQLPSSPAVEFIDTSRVRFTDFAKAKSWFGGINEYVYVCACMECITFYLFLLYFMNAVYHKVPWSKNFLIFMTYS